MPSFRSFRTGIRPIPWHKVGRLSIADVSCHSVGTAGISSHPVNQTWVSSAWRICLASDLAWSISSIIHHYTFRTHPALSATQVSIEESWTRRPTCRQPLGSWRFERYSMARDFVRTFATMNRRGFLQGIYHRNFGPFHSQVLNLWGFPLPLEVTQLGLIGRVEDCSILRT